MKKLFKIHDSQLGDYKNDGQWYNIREAIEQLASYHDADFEDERYDNIYEFLKDEKDDESRLAFLCEHGSWDLHYYIYHDKNDTSIIYGGEYDDEKMVEETLSEHKNWIVETMLSLN